MHVKRLDALGVLRVGSQICQRDLNFSHPSPDSMALGLDFDVVEPQLEARGGRKEKLKSDQLIGDEQRLLRADEVREWQAVPGPALG
jgi:hypothetical protein